jgi:acyl-CoA thioesterase
VSWTLVVPAAVLHADSTESASPCRRPGAWGAGEPTRSGAVGSCGSIMWSMSDTDPTSSRAPAPDEDPAPSGEPTRFARDTAVGPLGAGRYAATIDPSWWIIAGPNGGYVAAVVLRAILAEVADATRRPRSLTLQYLRPPAAGPVQVEVTVERAGRTVSNVSARLVQDGRLLVIALAALAVDRTESIAFDEMSGLPTMPDGSAVPVAGSIPEQDVDPDREVPMRQHYDLRWVLGDLPFQPPTSSEPTALTGGWLRPLEAEPIDEVVLAAMTDAWMPPIFSRVQEPLAVPTIDLTIHFRSLPADPLAHCFVVFDSPVARDGYLVEHGRIYSAEGVLLAESRQLAVVA